MLELLDHDCAAPIVAVGAETQECDECHFWHFGHCVHVTRYGQVGDGKCSHHKEARPVLGLISPP